jgi:hypothetical protein
LYLHPGRDDGNSPEVLTRAASLTGSSPYAPLFSRPRKSPSFARCGFSPMGPHAVSIPLNVNVAEDGLDGSQISPAIPQGRRAAMAE